MTLKVLDANADQQLLKTVPDGVTGELISAHHPVAPDGRSVALRDALFPAQVVLDHVHHEVHEGDSYKVEVVDESMADNDTLIVAFKTHATKRPHLYFNFTTLAGGHVELIEGPTWDTATGTNVPAINRLRVPPLNVSSLLQDTSGAFVAGGVVKNPVNLAGGVVIGTIYGFGKNQFSAQGSGPEVVLAPGVTYALRFTADGGSNAGQLTLRWYEHTDDTTT